MMAALTEKAPGASAPLVNDRRIPLAVPDLRGNEAAYLQECVRDNWVSSVGPHVAAFEEKIAATLKVKHAVAVVNGTCALQLAVRVAAEQSGRNGDLVLVPAWTFAATVNAVHHAGLTPYFVDVDPADWAMAPDSVAMALREHGRNVAAIVPVHPTGLPAGMDAIQDLASQHGIPLVEDSAGAIGATYRGKAAGTVGLAGILSFNGNKTVTAGGGGMVMTDDDAFAARVRSLSTQARATDRYQHGDIGYNYRMTNLNAAVGLAQTERLDEMLETKRRIASAYRRMAEAHPALSPQPNPDGRGHSWWMSCVRCDGAGAARSLMDHLQAAGIDARLFWENLSPQSAYQGFGATQLSEAERLSGAVLALPCSTSLTEEDQDYVIERVKAWA